MLLGLGLTSVFSHVLLVTVFWPYKYMIPWSCRWAVCDRWCDCAVLRTWRCTLAFFPRAEVESRNYRRTAAMKGIPLDQRDEDWELKKEELERNPPCSWENYASSAPKKNQKKRGKQKCALPVSCHQQLAMQSKDTGWPQMHLQGGIRMNRRRRWPQERIFVMYCNYCH